MGRVQVFASVVPGATDNFHAKDRDPDAKEADINVHRRPVPKAIMRSRFTSVLDVPIEIFFWWLFLGVGGGGHFMCCLGSLAVLATWKHPSRGVFIFQFVITILAWLDTFAFCMFLIFPLTFSCWEADLRDCDSDQLPLGVSVFFLWHFMVSWVSLLWKAYVGWCCWRSVSDLQKVWPDRLKDVPNDVYRAQLFAALDLGIECVYFVLGGFILHHGVLVCIISSLTVVIHWNRPQKNIYITHGIMMTCATINGLLRLFLLVIFLSVGSSIAGNMLSSSSDLLGLGLFLIFGIILDVVMFVWRASVVAVSVNAYKTTLRGTIRQGQDDPFAFLQSEPKAFMRLAKNAVMGWCPKKGGVPRAAIVPQ